MTDQPTTFLRAFPSNLTQTGDHQLTGLLVPYDSPTDVLDLLADGTRDIYREGFRRGAFSPQAGSTEKGVLRRIGLVHKHDGGLGYLGPFTALREKDDGLWGDATVLRSKATDVEDLLSAGVDELSVEFRLPRGNNTTVEGGVRWRTRAHLDAVALEPKGAYSGARVLAYRAEQDELDREHADQAAQEAADRAAVEARAQLVAREGQEIAERRRRFEELAGRFSGDLARQTDLVKTYGLTVPPRLPVRG